jgi:non-homologous end joining protein Ku
VQSEFASCRPLQSGQVIFASPLSCTHVLIDPKEIDDLKLEAKHTIDMVRFVDEGEIDTRYWEKPYYLVPDGDEAD